MSRRRLEIVNSSTPSDRPKALSGRCRWNPRRAHNLKQHFSHSPTPRTSIRLAGPPMVKEFNTHIFTIKPLPTTDITSTPPKKESQKPPSMETSPVTMLRLFLLLAASLSYSSAVQFSCTSSPTATCQSMIGYTPANSTTLSSVQSLFGVRSLLSLLGANGLPLSASPNQSVPAGSPVRVPIPCACSNGTGASDREPVYVVKEGNGLDFIAGTIFSGFVKFQEIAAANGIPDPNKIQPGQKLRIPLPCSCDDVDGFPTVHYGHVVAAGSTVAQIASAFGTREDTLLRLNGMDSPKNLKAGQILDVPLRACASSILNNSMDHNLLVPNGSYAITANDCVQCSCSSSYQLACAPVQGLTTRNTSVWAQCPSMQCNGNLSLGMTFTVGCNSTTCAYEGYNNQMIITGTVANTSHCNGTSAGSRHGLGWGHVFVVLNLGLLGLGMF